MFKLDTTGKQTILHQFTAGTDGALPTHPLQSTSLGICTDHDLWRIGRRDCVQTDCCRGNTPSCMNLAGLAMGRGL